MTTHTYEADDQLPPEGYFKSVEGSPTEEQLVTLGLDIEGLITDYPGKATASMLSPGFSMRLTAEGRKQTGFDAWDDVSFGVEYPYKVGSRTAFGGVVVGSDGIVSTYVTWRNYVDVDGYPAYGGPSFDMKLELEENKERFTGVSWGSLRNEQNVEPPLNGYRAQGKWGLEHPNAMDGVTYGRLVELVSIAKQHPEYLTKTTPDVVSAADNPARMAKTDPVYADIAREYWATHPEARRRARTAGYVTRALARRLGL